MPGKIPGIVVYKHIRLMANKKQPTINSVKITFAPGDYTIYEIGKDKCTGISTGINNGSPIVTVYLEGGIYNITYTGIQFTITEK